MTNTRNSYYRQTAIAQEMAIILASLGTYDETASHQVRPEWATIAQSAHMIALIAEESMSEYSSPAITTYNGKLKAPYSYAADLIDTARTDYEQMTA